MRLPYFHSTDFPRRFLSGLSSIDLILIIICTWFAALHGRRKLFPVNPFLLRHRRWRNKEVDATSLELRPRRQDQNPVDDSMGSWLGEDVAGVSPENVSGRDWLAKFFNKAIEMYHPDHVQGSTREDAGQATPEIIAHNIFFWSSSPLLPNLILLSFCGCRDGKHGHVGII